MVSHYLSAHFLSTRQRIVLPSLVAEALVKAEVSGEDEGTYPCLLGRSDSHNSEAPEMPSPEIFLLVS
jgi:hypothetical protein